MFVVFICKMAGFSSDASYKQHSPSKASVLGELHEAQRTIRRLEEKLQKMEVQQARPSHSIHGGHHSHRPSSRGSSNDFGREENHRRRQNPPQFHGHRNHNQGERHHRGEGYYQDAKARLPSVKIPSFCTALVVGSGDVASCYSIGVLARRQVGRREGSRGVRVVASC